MVVDKQRTQLVVLTRREAGLIKYLRDEIHTGEVRVIMRGGEPVRIEEALRNKEL